MKMKKSQSIFLLTAFCSIMATLPVSASADEEGTVAITPEQQAMGDQLIREAVENYAAKRYEEAIELFKQAYDIVSEPELLYNIARSYERLTNSEAAIQWYEKFLDAPGTTSELRSRALKNLAALEQERAAQKALEERERQAAEAAENAQGQTETTTEVTSSEDSSSTTDTSQNSTSEGPLGPDYTTSSDDNKKMSGMKIASFVLLGTGVATAVVGSIFGGLALGTKNDFDSSDYGSERVGMRDEMERNAVLFDVLVPTGAVLVAVGVSLFVVDAIKGNKERATGTLNNSIRDKSRNAFTIAPTLGGGNGSVYGGLTGRF